MKLHTSLYFPNIDRLTDRFSSESRSFFAAIPKHKHKELRKYFNYRKAEHQDNWSFSNLTYSILVAIDADAFKHYQEEIQYKQLRLF